MTVLSDTDRGTRSDRKDPNRRLRLSVEDGVPASDCIHIGLVNNMPDSALQSTERQFHSLLAAASAEIPIRLSLFALPGVPRVGLSARHVEQHYRSTGELPDAQLDALIVTGREPIAARLQDEPYWRHFVEMLEWAQEYTHSTVWSCLAAHAAILHMHGIRRVRSAAKHSGVFECAQIAEHPLIAGAPGKFQLPHSRWNGIPEEELVASGYTVLTRSKEVGVDTFVQQRNSLFVFFQGHPEYEPNALMLEYRRDVGRYLHGEIEAYPSMPQNYFDDETAKALRELEIKSTRHPRKELMTELAALCKKQKIESAWQPTATRIYRNWLEYIAARKHARQVPGKASAEAAHNDGAESFSTASA